jgi:hypothetical protein
MRVRELKQRAKACRNIIDDFDWIKFNENSFGSVDLTVRVSSLCARKLGVKSSVAAAVFSRKLIVPDLPQE